MFIARINIKGSEKMQIETDCQLFVAQDKDKLLVAAWKNGRLDSLGGMCKAKDFKHHAPSVGMG